jgi:enamine deaminase RidA (YjgF/YER057c/UK114 family)
VIPRQRFETDEAPPSTGFRSQALGTAGFLFTGGQIGAPYTKGEAVRELAPTFEGQVDAALTHLAAITREAGARLHRVVELSAFTTVPGGERIVRDRVAAVLGYEPLLVNHVTVDDCAMHGDVELDWAVLTDDALSLEEGAALLRPYMHGPAGEVLRSGPFLVLNGASAAGEGMRAQSEALLDLIEERLRPHGAGLADLAKLTVFISAFDIYPEFNEVTTRRFADITPPTRSVIVAPEVTGDALLRIDVLATAPAAEAL